MDIRKQERGGVTNEYIVVATDREHQKLCTYAILDMKRKHVNNVMTYGF